MTEIEPVLSDADLHLRLERVGLVDHRQVLHSDNELNLPHYISGAVGKALVDLYECPADTLNPNGLLVGVYEEVSPFNTANRIKQDGRVYMETVVAYDTLAQIAEPSEVAPKHLDYLERTNRTEVFIKKRKDELERRAQAKKIENQLAKRRPQQLGSSAWDVVD